MRTSWILALVPLAALAACDTVTTGDHGVLTFTPDECGQDSCSLDDDLVVGGTTMVKLESADDRNGGGDVFNLTLISSNPRVLQVAPVSSGSWSSEWRVTAVGPGVAEIVAIDGGGYEIDHTDVSVRLADQLTIERRSGNAVGPTVRLGYDQVWTVNAGQSVSLRTVPMRAGWRLMGRVAYRVDIDEVLFNGLEPGSQVEIGELDFRVPPGEYPVSFQAPDSTTLRVLIVAQ